VIFQKTLTTDAYHKHNRSTELNNNANLTILLINKLNSIRVIFPNHLSAYFFMGINRQIFLQFVRNKNTQ